MTTKLAAALALVTVTGLAYGQSTRCTVGDIVIKSTKAGFTQAAGMRYLQGISVLTNRCAEPVGVQIQVTGYDKAGSHQGGMAGERPEHPAGRVHVLARSLARLRAVHAHLPDSRTRRKALEIAPF